MALEHVVEAHTCCGGLNFALILNLTPDDEAKSVIPGVLFHLPVWQKKIARESPGAHFLAPGRSNGPPVLHLERVTATVLRDPPCSSH